MKETTMTFILSTLYGDIELTVDQFEALYDEALDLVCEWEDKLNMPLYN